MQYWATTKRSCSKYRREIRTSMNDWAGGRYIWVVYRWSSSLEPPKKVDQISPFDDLVQVTVTFLWHSNPLKCNQVLMMMMIGNEFHPCFYLRQMGNFYTTYRSWLLNDWLITSCSSTSVIYKFGSSDSSFCNLQIRYMQAGSRQPE